MTTVKARINKLEAKRKQSVPKQCLIVMPGDKDAVERFKARYGCSPTAVIRLSESAARL